MAYRVYIDGASRSNPGPSGIGVYIETDSGEPLDCFSEYIGETTNNTAEYTALIRGLERARSLGLENIHVFSDSQLVVRQLKGLYRVKAPNLRGLYIAANSLAETFDSFELTHIHRGKNSNADALANEALDKRAK